MSLLLQLKHLDWRQEFKIDTILQPGFNNIPEDALNVLPADIVGVNKEGSPILVVFSGALELKKNLQKYGKKTCLDVLHFFLEAAVEEIRTKSTDPNVFRKGDYVLDMEGLRFKECFSSDVLDVIITILKEVEANYPEMLNKAYLLNAPSIFPVLWNMLKPFLSQKTIDKIHICNSNLQKFRTVLLDQIPENQLPRRWGGTGYSGRLPQLNRSFSTSACTTEFEQKCEEKNISAGDTFELTFEVEAPQALLSWSFKTKNYDIGFTVLHRPFSGGDLEETEIIEYKRVNAQKLVQNGSFICEASGQYILRFDNTYSRLRSKEIMYLVEIAQLTTNGNYVIEVFSQIMSKLQMM
ncbi:unnamed protein product [Orchesella dallaii]|uniref:SEC14-like protein 2 n=1 Tax=Orchesella dallaii TaxID=48710 RepID=A0ABP1RBL5_9HEXA